ncbi:uncharacterized protein LOC114354432 [Ostrinia furnacalis]|uniref:uncharacterized protein LOC114354432 n=1 Tax=Ostrinia furnacalis TaxID=93504 RepID=UPI001039290E|nr:uncharacterized protein LOC114354432 [Ostrinia furnacalis]
MESVRTQNKLKLLFEKLQQPNYVMNSYYADSFINKISNISDPETSNLIDFTFLRDQVIDAMRNMDSYHNTVNVFLGRILAIVSRKEQHFNKILEKNGDKLLETFNKIDLDTMNPSLKVAYLEIAIAIVSHNSGVSWILKSELWKKLLTLYQKPSTIFVLRLVYKFVSEFLWKLDELDDEPNLTIILGHIAKPILEVNYIDTQNVTCEEEDEYCKKFEPVLQMFLSALLSKIDRVHQKNKIMSILMNEINFQTHLHFLLERIRNENVSMLIIRLIFAWVLLRVFQKKPYLPGVVYKFEDFIELQALYFNMIHYLIQKRNVMQVVDCCNNCNSMVRTVFNTLAMNKLDDERENKLQYQMLFIYLVPLLVYINKTAKGNCKGSMTNDRINEYISTFVHMSCEHTSRAAYALRDLILEQDVMNITFESVKRLTFFKDQLNDQQANTLFQALFYVLREYDPTDDYGEIQTENLEDSEQKVLVMTYVMDTVLSLVKRYNIKWHASLEVACLNVIVHNILTRRPNLTCKFVLASLGVMTVTVQKFLPPNLSLLMEAEPGSAIHEMGKLMFTKMHDINWEVRDSALELLNVCTEISYIKFPPFRKQIIENKLITVAATIAFNDHEPYVQVSALKCVGASCKISSMWEQLQGEHPNFLDRMIAVLRNNQEGIVRKEACNVLCEIYQHIKLAPNFRQALYEHMASAAISDFHWEVQLSALKFWKFVIQSYLTDQGMLDGTFPPVTFSRESRKIVTLNEAEIRKRLLKLLDELAANGCLTVLLKLLHEDTEVEVMDAALCIAEELNEILVKYKVPDIVVIAEGEPKSMEDLVCVIEPDEVQEEQMDHDTATTSDNVIDGIIKCDDMNLLANIYQKHMSLDKPDAPKVTPKLKITISATPYLFVNYMRVNDFKNTIKQKREWKDGIRSVSSLLDDVLGLYDDNEEVNSLDCY